MKVELVERRLKPKGVPVALEIEARVFEGDSSSEILDKVKHYFAEEVIPYIPLIRLDKIYREKIRRMTTVEVSRMLVDYVNDQEAAFEKKFPLPETDDQALETLERMGFLIAEP